MDIQQFIIEFDKQLRKEDGRSPEQIAEDIQKKNIVWKRGKDGKSKRVVMGAKSGGKPYPSSKK